MRKLFIVMVMCLMGISASAQCSFRNTAFKSGEYLSYNLYFNWKFVWIKVGTASMNTVQSNFRGRPSYRCSLITRGNSKADHFFVLRDTLLCYSSLDLAPVYYHKGAHEGDRYYTDEVFYTYPEGRCHVRQHQITSKGESLWQQHTYNECVFDMLNIFLRARSFNPSNWKKGYVVNFDIVDGDSKNPAMLKYNGKKILHGSHVVSVKALGGDLTDAPWFIQEHVGDWADITDKEEIYTVTFHDHAAKAGESPEDNLFAGRASDLSQQKVAAGEGVMVLPELKSSDSRILAKWYWDTGEKTEQGDSIYGVYDCLTSDDTKREYFMVGVPTEDQPANASRYTAFKEDKENKAE